MFVPRFLHSKIGNAAQYIPAIAELELGIEIQFDATDELWPQLRWENLLDLKDAIMEFGLPVSVHGPYNGLDLGSRDAHIRQYSLETLAASLEAARALRSPQVIFHSGCWPQYSPAYRQHWLDDFSRALDSLLNKAADVDVRLALENTYETDLTLFENIFARFETPQLGMCFDVGHAACFGRVDIGQWTKRFADRIFHVHCHDNDGNFDLHRGLGEGVVDFHGALTPLARFDGEIGVTLEVPLEKAAASREYLDRLIVQLTHEE
jgi:sugar phosphate isomerase/epimerase